MRRVTKKVKKKEKINFSLLNLEEENMSEKAMEHTRAGLGCLCNSPEARLAEYFFEEED